MKPSRKSLGKTLIILRRIQLSSNQRLQVLRKRVKNREGKKKKDEEKNNIDKSGLNVQKHQPTELQIQIMKA